MKVGEQCVSFKITYLSIVQQTAFDVLCISTAICLNLRLHSLVHSKWHEFNFFSFSVSKNVCISFLTTVCDTFCADVFYKKVPFFLQNHYFLNKQQPFQLAQWVHWVIKIIFFLITYLLGYYFNFKNVHTIKDILNGIILMCYSTLLIV